MGSAENVICIIVLFLLLLVGFTASLDLLTFMNDMEQQVKSMAAEIVRLDNARCDLVANYSPSSCSRHACTPTDGFDDLTKYNFECQDKDRPNQDCSFNGNACNGRKLNYATSYIRLAPNIQISKISNGMCSTICMTRDFTGTLKRLATINNYIAQFYFCSMDGVIRIFPGEERDGHKCFTFDSRRRGWYNGAIYVQTYYIILIDNSYSARTSESGSPTISTVMNASIQIVQQLIFTPSSKDILDVITFNETDATALSSTPVIIVDYDGSGDFNDYRKGLLDRISNISMGAYSPNSTGFVKAISTAFQNTRYNNGPQFTVMLVFTNGDFNTVNLQRQPITEMLNNHSTKLFIYSFADSQNLQALANESGGYYEFLHDNFDNPLYQISSFFNFMALARNGSDDEPYWTKYYNDFGGRGPVITVSYKALSPMGHLVGVTAIDILSESVLNALQSSPKLGKRPSNPSVLITPNRTAATNYTCGNCNGLEAVCPQTSSKSFAELDCCDTCFPTSNERSRGKIIAATVVPAVAVLVLVISVAWWVKQRRAEPNNAAPANTWPYE